MKLFSRNKDIGVVKPDSVFRMRILHIIASVDPRSGGPIEGVLQQAAHRPSEKYITEIACLDAPDEAFVGACAVKVFAFGKAEGKRVAGWRARLPWVRYNFQPDIVPWLRKNVGNYDLVVVNGLWNYATMAARLALVGNRTPYVVFTHGMLDPWFKRTYPLKSALKQIFWLFCEGPLLNNAGAVLFTTEEERMVSRKAFWPYRVRERVVSYGAADVGGDALAQEAAFRAATPQLGGRRYLLYLSRIHPKKGIDLLIDAFAEVAAAHPDLDLVVAGPDQVGLRRKLEASARARGVDRRIHWPGMLVGDVKLGAYRGCEAFVLPSHQENFGIVVAEAMAAGKPVLISEKVQIWREVTAGGGGLAEPDDAAGTLRLLQRFLALSPDARLGMGSAARATFLERFEMKKAVTIIDQALVEVLGARPH